MSGIFNIIPQNTQNIILDFDGTIALTHHIWPNLNKKWFERLGCKDDPYEFDRLATNTTFEQASQLLLKRNPYLKQSLQEVIQATMDISFEEARKCQFVPGAEQFILECYKNRINMCIATTSSVEFVEAFFETKNPIFSQIFKDKIISCEKLRIYKGNPEVYRICNKTFFGRDDFHRCVIIEDSLKSIKGASHLRPEGCLVIAIGPDDERKQYADKVVKDLTF